MFSRIDHVGVAVEQIDPALALYRDTLQMRLAHREVVAEQGVEAALLDVGEGHVELLAPLQARHAGRALPGDAAGPGFTTWPTRCPTSSARSRRSSRRDLR